MRDDRRTEGSIPVAEPIVMIDDPESGMHPMSGTVRVSMPARTYFGEASPSRPRPRSRSRAKGKRTRTASSARSEGGGDGDPAPGPAPRDQVLLSAVPVQPPDPKAFARTVMEARVRLALAHVRALMERAQKEARNHAE